MVHTEPDWLDYTKQPPASLPAMLASIRVSEETAVPVPVFWGAHESTFGIRDFSKSSKLRLEKLLVLAAQSKTRLTLHLGFFPNAKTFPDWSREVEEKSYVPEPLWEDSLGVLRKTQIPSLLSEKLTAGFIAFLDEVLSIVSLYRAPEGPVVEIQVHTGIYELDLSLADHSAFRRLFAERYPDIQTLNQRFQTTFKNLEDATTKNGLRTLSDKRPWLAAYDYQWCRRQCLADFSARVGKSFSQKGMADLLKFGSAIRTDEGQGDFEVIFEDTLIETLGRNTVYPRSLSGIPNPMSVLAFRMAEHIEAACRENKLAFSFLMNESTRTEKPRYCVISGRYLPSSAQRSLAGLLDQGRTLFFPFGLPHFNEELEPIDWAIKARNRASSADEEFLQLKTLVGQIITPVVDYPMTPETFDRIRKSMGSIRSLEN